MILLRFLYLPQITTLIEIIWLILSRSQLKVMITVSLKPVVGKENGGGDGKGPCCTMILHHYITVRENIQSNRVCHECFRGMSQRIFPAGIWCQNDVVSTSMRRNHVASTLIRRHFRTKCPLGSIRIFLSMNIFLQFRAGGLRVCAWVGYLYGLFKNNSIS